MVEEDMTMKKILFVVLPYRIERKDAVTKLRSFVAFPYGVLSIATYLKKNTDTVVRVFDCNLHDNFQEELVIFNPDIVALSMMFGNSYKYVSDIAKQVKDWNGNTLVVIGGSATRGSYEEIMGGQPQVDMVCDGEGEIPFLKLVNDIPSPAWITRESLQAGIVPVKENIQNLDEVIELDYSYVNIDDYQMEQSFGINIKKDAKQFFVITSRGCCFDCKFCMNAASPDKKIRYASVEKVIRHVRELVDKYGMNVLTLYDDQLLFNKKRAKELFRQLAQFNLRVDCPNGLSVAFIDNEMAGLMKKAGMDTIKLAIESGSPYVLYELINKPLKLPMVKPIVEMLHRHGLWVEGYFVIGMPGETDKHRKETVAFIKDVGIDWSSCSSAMPLVGTPLFKECLEKGYFKDVTIDSFDTTNTFIDTPEYSHEYINEQTYLINLDVNFVNNRTMKIGDYQNAANLFRQVIVLYPYQAFAHYYLSECYQKLGNTEEARKEMKEYKKILKTKPEWIKWGQQFGLEQ